MAEKHSGETAPPSKAGLLVQDGPASSLESGVAEPSVHLGKGELEVIRIREGNVVLRKLRGAEEWMDKKLHVEGTGAQRILESERHPPRLANMIFFWLSMLTSPSYVSMGILGPRFGLSVNESIWVTVLAVAFGSIIPAFTATLCPQLGLRQIAASRFAFGIWGSKFCGFLNIIVNIGFGTINCIIAGQLLRGVSGDTLSDAVGIIIVLLGSYVISFFGFRVIHMYESVAWILIFVLICVQYGQAARYYSPTPGLSYVSALDRSGAALSYFAILFGSSAAWCSMSGDYYVHYPPKTNKWLLFGLTWIGLTLPTAFIAILGNLYGGMVNTNSELSTVYKTGGLGGLMMATMRPLGYSRFVAVMYALSFMGNEIAILYSSSLSIQLWGRHFMAVPRFVWNTLLAAISLGLGWGGRHSLESIISNFLSLLGYWTICFGVVLAIEAFWFRPRLGGYDIEGWQDQSRMPLGLAGCVTLAIAIGISFLGMDQTWFIGPVAKPIGSSGGDVGNYFVLVVVLFSYPVLRHLEIKHFGR
ncbi:hypothetical protein A1O1_08700 [Capronia coronata CBS 617.96]|uniref:NCS1 family nucleobase:cation symporter-1 n=1 Tax=Capronia coronata CBS 617.96 TaxID=1182541 RepID=W9YE16_9EURO|nr:uncharacterized protein A1O1_08700 [Capronia coronata CBS 617.96]EXJ80554.1 hypothetical protein A1O1_08700 [Capronia coronata CBS 617.96]